MLFKKKYAIKRKFNGYRYMYYPVYSYFGLFWYNLKEDTGYTYPLIGPYGIKTIQALYVDVCYTNLEDAKAHIGKIILAEKIKNERKDKLIKFIDEINETNKNN